MKITASARKSRFSGWVDRLLPVLFVVSLAAVCFIVGAFVAEFDVPLYQDTLKPSLLGLRAMVEEREANPTMEGWYLARDTKSGVTVHEPERTHHGLTLFASYADGCGARLISMDGKVVHRWQLPYYEAWPEPSHVPSPVSIDRIHWWRVRMLPGGELIANCAGIGDTPNGYGLVKVDKDSKLIWKYSECAHHDFDIDNEGKIYALVHSIRYQRVKAAPHLRTPLLEDYVVVLSPAGEELVRIPIFDAFARSKFRDYLDAIRSDNRGDHTHSNAIDVVSAEFAKKRNFCSAGDVMISLRNPGVIAILSLRDKKIVWAGKGTWERQHDSDPLPNGNIMLFDNRGNQGKGGKSRVLEWNPKSGAIVWSFTRARGDRFESLTRGCQQQLPNGNVLVTESNNGRILEITRDEKVVWEYCNPSRSGEKDEKIAVIFNAERYDPAKLTFLNSQGGSESEIDAPAEAAAKGNKSGLR